MKKFTQKFKVTEKIANEDHKINLEPFNIIYPIIKQHGGESYNNGLFKVHTFEYVQKWTQFLKSNFKNEIKPFNLMCFASNWQGVIYCTNSTDDLIVYFDPSTCEYFEAPVSINEFFNSILTGGEYDIIFEEYFHEAKNYLKFINIPFDKSIGHKVFLHLGGEDDVQNLEIIDTEVMWDLEIEVVNRINEISD